MTASHVNTRCIFVLDPSTTIMTSGIDSLDVTALTPIVLPKFVLRIKTTSRVSIASILLQTRSHFAISPTSDLTQRKMAGTRSSARTASNSSSPAKNDDSAAGSKRKPDAQPSPARNKKAPKKQATLEESGITNDNDDSEMKDASDQDKDTNQTQEEDEKSTAPLDAAKTDTSTEDAKKEEDDSAAKVDTTKDNAKPESNGDAVQESSQRKQDMPSNILEKGLIYFFTRNRVGIDDAESVGDLQRTFFVLRPLPTGAKLGDGAIPDMKNNRLFALPKKAFPKSHNDRFMSFVEKANTTIQDLKNNFFGGSEYETKTQGTRRVDPVTPVAEGVYAITRTEDRTTHLVYSTTIPSDLGEIQEGTKVPLITSSTTQAYFHRSRHQRSRQLHHQRQEPGA